MQEISSDSEDDNDQGSDSEKFKHSDCDELLEYFMTPKRVDHQ